MVETDLRRRVHGNYQIFYRVTDDLVFVVRVLHGARDYEALLWETNRAAEIRVGKSASGMERK